MLNTPLRRLRFIGFIEGISYLVLLGIAMPLKYLAGLPLAVRVVGSVHGFLFVLFFLAVAEVTIRRPWWSAAFWLKAVVASIVPFGTFVFDRWLQQVEIDDAALLTGERPSS
jgi:integral membrane protein